MEAHTAILARCKLSASSYAAMDNLLWSLNWLYNSALEQRKTAYRERGESVNLYDQYKWLTKLRAANEHGLAQFALGPQRGMLKRLDASFKSLFRRVQAGQTPGFPRFRPISRCVTIDVTVVGKRMIREQGSFCVLRVSGFPRIKLYPCRSLPAGEALQNVRLTKRGRHWEASLVYAVERDALEPSVKAVGIDLGVRKRMTLSDGTTYPRHRCNGKRQRRLQRAVSRCKRGSKTRRKRVAKLAGFRRKECVAQRNQCHRATTDIIRANGLVAMEKLKVSNMTRSAKGSKGEPGRNVARKSGLNREILSQNWSLLRQQLKYKAAWAGREFVEVDPKHTSQDCHRCHARNNPGTSETYRCAACGLVADRGVNAATNILAAGVIAAGASTWAVGPCVVPEPYANAA